jgi:hypothetical protein
LSENTARLSIMRTTNAKDKMRFFILSLHYS